MKYKQWARRTYDQRQTVRYLCQNAPDFELTGEHTTYTIDYHGMDGRNAAWASHLRGKVCPHCGGQVIHERQWVREHGGTP